MSHIVIEPQEINMTNSPPTPTTVQVSSLHQQFQNIKAAERTSHAFIETLLRHVQTLSDDRDASVLARQQQEARADIYRDQYEAATAAFNTLQRTVDCSMFVLVVIDGDNTLFTDAYVRRGLQGGEQAARDLHRALFDYFTAKRYFKNDYVMVAKVYVNLLGLAKKYHDTGIVASADVFPQFVQGFNKTYDLMDIVDAGNGKEGADDKVKGTVVCVFLWISFVADRCQLSTTAEVNLFRRNVHCRQIMLAGSGDNSYGGLLRQYAPNTGKSETITLIKALPFAREIQQLSDRFETVSFDDIFRDTKIGNRRPSVHGELVGVQLPPPVPASSRESSVGFSALHASNVRHAQGGANSASDVCTPTTPSLGDSQSDPLSRSPRFILVNRFGQRLDASIEAYQKDVATTLKQRKLCNTHFLTNDCNRGNTCAYTHRAVLSSIELENLRFIARLTSCRVGLLCHDPDCYDGHRCLRGNQCTNNKCFFNAQMHAVDTSDPQLLSIPA